MLPDISVIISTYKNPAYLKLSLESYQKQVFRNFEIIVADDGSTDVTKDLVKEVSTNINLPLKHVWQPDAGFRLAKIRNKAVRDAEGDYIFFTDQDCVAHPELLQDLVDNASSGQIIQGSRRNCSPVQTQEIISDEILTPNELNKLSRPFYSYILNNFTLLHIGALTGCNFSLFKEDLEQLDGFCEEYEGWGAEDFDLGFRAFKQRLKFKYLFGKAYVYHLYHPQKRDYFNHNYCHLYRKMLLKR